MYSDHIFICRTFELSFVTHNSILIFTVIPLDITSDPQESHYSLSDSSRSLSSIEGEPVRFALPVEGKCVKQIN